MRGTHPPPRQGGHKRKAYGARRRSFVDCPETQLRLRPAALTPTTTTRGTSANDRGTQADRAQTDETPAQQPADEVPADALEVEAPVAAETAETAPDEAEAADASAQEAPAQDAAETAEAKPAEAEPPTISDEMPDEKVLDLDKLIITRADDGTPRLEIKEECCHIGFRATRLFPISRRHDYISIADLTGTEIGIIPSLRKMDKAMRRIVLEEIRRRYFVPQITYVHSLKDEFGVLYWDVDTTGGAGSLSYARCAGRREFAGGGSDSRRGRQLLRIANVDTSPAGHRLYRTM